MTMLREESEARTDGGRDREEGFANPESLLWTRLTSFRSQAARLGFHFIKRECSRSNAITSRVNLFLHPGGTWLDLGATVDGTMRFGPVVATFRSWALDHGELVEVDTLAGTPLPDSRLPRSFVDFVERLLGANADIHPLHSPVDLATALERHRALLDARALSPLIAADDALEERRQWERNVNGSVWMIAPP